MSLVEKALRKGQAALAGAGRGAPGTPSGQSPRTSVATRVAIGDPARRCHLDVEALRQAGLIPPSSEERQIAHQFRSIKRPLIQRAFEAAAPEVLADRAQRSIMVSSALPGDGKTFTSLNLALSMALERDHSVILVDGDLPKPHISDLFNARNEVGLLDVLEDPSLSVASVVLQTDMPGLCLLPVGRPVANATELVASCRMREVVRELEALDAGGIVVVDSPPILLTSEARVLASLFNQLVLVVRAGGTPQQAVKDALKLIGDGPQIELVLNQALHVENGGYYYGYGSEYGHGH